MRMPPLMPHQKKFLEEFSSKKGFALFWEQGTGKTAPLIYEAIDNFRNEKIQVLLVIGPTDIVDNWITDEFPTHADDEFLNDAIFFRVRTSKVGLVSTQKMWQTVIETDKPVIVTIGFDAISGKSLDKLRMLLSHKTYALVVDESRHVKDPKTLRAKVILGSKYNKGGFVKNAVYRRIACGTPTSGSPFDFYTQVEIACPGYWASKGIGNFHAFKLRFGVYETGYAAGGRQFPKLVKYKNLDTLKEYLREISWRLLKKDVLQDLPPKIRMPNVSFDLSPKEWKVYRQIKDDAYIEIASEPLTLANGLVIAGKLRQASSGFLYHSDIGDGITLIEEKPSRLMALNNLLDNLDNPNCPMIIFSEYKIEGEQIRALLKERGLRVGSFRGSDEDKLDARHGFQSGKYDVFEANPSSCSEGVTLTRAEVVIYYSHGLKLIQRLQSEDRAHRKGLNHNVLYFDIVANDSYDQRLMEIRRNNEAVAKAILDDESYTDLEDPIDNIGNLSYVLFGAEP